MYQARYRLAAPEIACGPADLGVACDAAHRTRRPRWRADAQTWTTSTRTDQWRDPTGRRGCPSRPGLRGRGVADDADARIREVAGNDHRDRRPGQVSRARLETDEVRLRVLNGDSQVPRISGCSREAAEVTTGGGR